MTPLVLLLWRDSVATILSGKWYDSSASEAATSSSRSQPSDGEGCYRPKAARPATFGLAGGWEHSVRQKSQLRIHARVPRGCFGGLLGRIAASARHPDFRPGGGSRGFTNRPDHDPAHRRRRPPHSGQDAVYRSLAPVAESQSRRDLRFQRLGRIRRQPRKRNHGYWSEHRQRCGNWRIRHTATVLDSKPG